MKRDLSSAFKIIGRATTLWWGDWVNQVLVSLITILVSLTIILAGPALMGAAREAQDLHQGIRTGIAGWWQGFKQHLWKGILWGVVNLFVLIVLAVGGWFYYSLEFIWAPILMILVIVAGIFWITLQFYSLGYFIEQQEKTLKLAWKNAFLTVVGAPFFTLVVGTFNLLITIFSLGTFIPLFVGSPTLLTILSVTAVHNRLVVYKKIPYEQET